MPTHSIYKWGCELEEYGSVVLLFVATGSLVLEPDKVVGQAIQLSIPPQVFEHLQRIEKGSLSKLSVHIPLVAFLGITLTTG